MARQGVITTKTTRTVRFGNGNKTKEPETKGVVTVPPHVRMINGKPVFVAGYTYRR